MIRNIVFDFGGVLADFDPERTLRRAFDDADVPLIRQALFDSGLWSQLDLGRMRLDEVAAAACRTLPQRMHRPLTDLLVDWWSDMPPIDGMEAFARALKDSGCALYLLSNVSDDLYRHFDEYPVLSLMDGVCASFEHGVIKPDPRLYEALYRTFSLDPAQCFFIDDMPQNIEGAARTGMAGHCFADRDLCALREDMRRHGITI